MDFQIITAVIAGDRTLEARIFAACNVSVQAEKILTSKLCRLMNRSQQQWHRYNNNPFAELRKYNYYDSSGMFLSVALL